MIFSEHLRVRHVTPVTIDFPTFRESTQRNTGIILNNHAAVFEQEIAHTPETFTVHEVGGGLEETQARPLLGAPAEEGAFATGKISLEVIQCLPAAGAGETDLHPFRRILD